MLERIERSIQLAVEDKSQCPDPIVIAIFSNDLRKTISLAFEYGMNLVDLGMAIRFVYSRVATQDINAVLKKWGKRK